MMRISIVSVLVFFGLSASFVSAEPAPEIKIAGIYGLTGVLAEMSSEMKNGAVLACEELAQNKNIHLKAIFEDSQWQAKGAVSAFKKVAAVDRVRFVHVLGSAMSLAVKPLSEAEGVLLFSAAAHSEILKNSKLVIRHSNRADNDARILAEAVAVHRPKQLVTIYPENDWTNSYNEEFREALKKLLVVEIREESYPAEETDFRSLITRVLSTNPDVVMINSFGMAAGLLVTETRKRGFKGPLFANNGLALSADAMKLVSEFGPQNFYYQTYADPERVFASHYKKRFGTEAGIFALSAYSDFELLGEAITKVGREPKDVAKYIKNLGVFEGTYQRLVIEPGGDIVLDTVVRKWE